MARRLKADAKRILRAALDAVCPEACVLGAVRRNGARLLVGETAFDLQSARRVLVLGIGKAAVRMASGLETILGSRIDGGLVLTVDGYGRRLRYIDVEEGGHPLPDNRGFEASRRLAALADDAGAGDLVVAVVSGGGSALLALPDGDLTLEDLASTDALLLTSGMAIGEMNAVRKHVSALRGGRLAVRIHPARLIVLVLSDVPGDPLPVIASGPMVPDPSTFAEAVTVLCRFDLWKDLSSRVQAHFSRGERGTVPETPKPGDPRFEGVVHRVVGSGRTAALAALEAGEQLGYQGLLLTTTLQGEAREVGKVLAGLGRELASFGRPIPTPALVVAAGETTVTVRGRGMGGRNQELALAAAVGIAEMEHVVIASLGTDGRDGPTAAAGGIVDGGTVGALRRRGIDPLQALEDNDSHTALRAVDALLQTGPTGTNVADLVVVLAGPSRTAAARGPS